MKKEDFKNLTIDTPIYYNGEKTVVNHLKKVNDTAWIGFTRWLDLHNWKNICQDCSLEKPVTSPKIYRVSYFEHNGGGRYTYRMQRAEVPKDVLGEGDIFINSVLEKPEHFSAIGI